MACKAAFNDLLGKFFSELSLVFPEDKKLKVCIGLYETFTQQDPELPLKTWLETLGSDGDMITAKDPALFDKHPILFNSINLKEMWNSNISENNRSNIWQYLATLNVLGQTLSNLPPEMLSTVETMATSLASSMQSSEGGTGGLENMDFMKLFSSLSGLMGGAPSQPRPIPKKQIKPKK